jgi:hypothetical protein
LTVDVRFFGVLVSMKIKTIFTCSLLAFSLGVPQAFAAVSQQEAKKLGTELTPMGGERGGNVDGSVPAWTGSMSGVLGNVFLMQNRSDRCGDNL